ncbi:MAG: tRNA dihydrouridine synthase DusB [Clostridia bacterium]|nr:tRNA dihydrouridine synthase DusB [Clostridia bacterium]
MSSLCLNRPFSVRDVIIANPLVLAPMAGVCDGPFRLLCKEQGCALVYTEMISAMALTHDNRRTHQMMRISDEERPVSIQVFGPDPAVLADAARAAEKAGADIIDINMGCPVPKVVRNSEGSALMRDPERAWAIVRAVCGAAKVPVTVKIRKGWDESSVNAAEFAKGCAGAGASAVAVHGRTKAQGYSGKADWSIIARVVEAVDVPVIGNGDIRGPEDVARMMAETGCAGVMIGRAALGNPWIFEECLHYLRTGELLPGPTPSERIAMAARHLADSARHSGERTATSEMRKHLAWYIRGLRGATRVRDQINTAPDLEALRGILAEYRESMAPR